MNWFSRLFATPQPASSTPDQLQPAADDPVLSAVDALIDQRDVEAAETLLIQATSSSARTPAFQLRLASCARLRGDTRLSRATCEALLETNADASLIQLELGLCAMAELDLTSALDHLEVAVALHNGNARAWLQLGKCLARLERWHDAEQPLRQALVGLSGEAAAEAWYTLGEAQRMQHRFIDAQQSYKHCLVLKPDHLLCHIAAGHVLMFLEEETTALQHYESAMALSSQLPPSLKLNVASIHQHLGRYDDARAVFERIVDERPGDAVARWYLCQLDLLECRWPQGWASYPSRFGAKAVPYRPMPFPTWEGQPLAGETLLVLADEGLGDEIMFASCLRDVVTRAPSCIVECDPRLHRLFARSFPQLHVVSTERQSSTQWLSGLPTPSFQIFAGDLPALFRKDDTAFPNTAGYLQADPERVAQWRQRLAQLPGTGPIIGLSWRGGITGTRTKARSISAQQWGDILSVPGVRFVNLQYGNYQTELRTLEHTHGVVIHDFPEAIADYDETAALVCALDQVISVCTAIIHLAGSLGRPVWVLTPFAPGWRYTASRDTLPWYPSSRIFRQHRPNDWDGACQDLSAALREATKNVTTDSPACDVLLPRAGVRTAAPPE
jgi:tetratricopeptide (TPR) repeat protein